MRFLVDVGLGSSVATWLRANGHDAIHLMDAGLERLRDVEILSKASQEDRIVVTTDLDFTDLAFSPSCAARQHHHLPLRVRRAQRVISRLATVLPVASEALTKGAIVIVEESRHRTRALP